MFDGWEDSVDFENLHGGGVQFISNLGVHMLRRDERKIVTANEMKSFYDVILFDTKTTPGMYHKMGNSGGVHLKAPAKINLFLRVVGQREDGYHELETWMQKLLFHDSITFFIKETPGIELHCSSSEVPAGPENLLWRTADLFFCKSQNSHGKGIEIYLDKVIPVSAGLGGGSSDAGTLLKGLNNYFGREFDEESLITLAASLGADVPFFVTDMESVLATGIGEKMVEVTPLSDCTFVLVNPGISISTAEVFRKFALTRTDKNFTLTGSQKKGSESLTLFDLHNDLEAVVLHDFPVIGDIKKDLLLAGADGVLMSGSGSTVFAVFTGISTERRKVIDSVEQNLRKKYGDKIYITQ